MKSLIAIAVTILFTSCGQDESSLPKDSKVTPDNFSSAVTELHQSKPGSYIVAFYDESQEAEIGLKGVLADASRQQRNLSGTYLTESEVRAVDYISSIDLRDLQEPPQKNMTNFAPAFRQLWPSFRKGHQTLQIAAIDFYSEEAAERALSRWRASGRLAIAEPNSYSYLGQDLRWSEIAETYSNFGSKPEWQSLIKLEDALNYLGQSGELIREAPVIAIMDSGVDLNHPHFANVKWENSNVGSSGCANDINGCNTTSGKKAVLGDGNVSPPFLSAGGCDENTLNDEQFKGCTHGTHVAAIAAGINEAQGLSGVCPFCKVMPIRIQAATELNPNGAITDDSILRGFVYLSKFVNNNRAAIRIVNASFGQYRRNRIHGLYVRLLEKNQTLVIGAAGNEDSMERQYPGAFDAAIAVASLGNSQGKLSSSNFGQWVDIAAPGQEINSATPGSGGYTLKSGTSMAAPVVSGVAGLILAANPDLTVTQLRNRLLKSTDPSIYQTDVNLSYNPKLSGEISRIPLLGSGMLNAFSAVNPSAVSTGASGTADERVSAQCGSIYQGEVSSLNWWIVFTPVLLVGVLSAFQIMTAARD